MSTLQDQIDDLHRALGQLRTGDSQVFDQLPVLLENLRITAERLERRQRALTSLYEVGQEIVSILNLRRLLGSILDRATVLVGAERGFLVLSDTVGETFRVPVARRFNSGEVDDAQIEISRGIIRRVLTQREPIVTTNAQEDPRFQSSNSVITYQIRSVLATPLIANDELIGAIYVDTRINDRLFDQDDLALFSAMANQAAVAIRLTRLYEDLQARNRQLADALKELQETHDELIRAERLSVVGRMAATIIHDLKNPMTAIQGYASLLGREDITPEARQRYSRIITHSVAGFVETAQEILDFSRGEGDLERDKVYMDKFIRDLCLFIEREFQEKGLTLRCQLDYTGPVVMDEGRMRRVLYNIASNAYDAMKPGGCLTVFTRVIGSSLEIRVSDTGPGIPTRIQDTLFEPFVTHGKPTGTGLGLAIARKTVEDHGGTIAVESRPGEGATFIIHIPLA